MKKTIITTLLICIAPFILMAQQTNDLSPEEIDAFKIQCQERVDAFQMVL